MGLLLISGHSVSSVPVYCLASLKIIASIPRLIAVKTSGSRF